MEFLKQNKDKIVGWGAVLLLLLFALRIALFLTIAPADEGTFRYWLYDTLGIEAASVVERPAEHPKQVTWSFEGNFDQYDMASVRRGLEVYRNSCAACHSLNRIAFRNLIAIGYSEDAAKELAASYLITAGPNADGDMFERPGDLADYFPAPFANENAAKAMNNGKAPPDLSLIIKARANGPDYLYSLLTGYGETPPADFEPRSDVTTFNPYFEGWEINMPEPLFDGLVDYADGTEATTDQMSQDVVNFLTWAASPEQDARREMGLKVLLYTLFLTILLYFSMRKIWGRIKK